MVTLNLLTIDLDECERSLDGYKKLLDSNEGIGEKRLDHHFRNNPQLILLMGSLGISNACNYACQFNVFDEYFSDFAICNLERNDYVFVEFEEAEKDSIFQIKTPGTTKTSYKWSSTLEKGFGQILDWFYRLTDMKDTGKFKEEFDVVGIEYTGFLVVGRRKHSIPSIGLHEKFDWRRRNVFVQGRPVVCFTFDDLYNEMKGKLDELRSGL